MKKIILNFCIICSVLCLSSCFKVGHTEYIDILQLNVEEPDKVYKVGDTVKFTITGTLDTNLYSKYSVDVGASYNKDAKKEIGKSISITGDKFTYNLNSGNEIEVKDFDLEYKFIDGRIYTFNDKFEFTIEEPGYYYLGIGMVGLDAHDSFIDYNGCKQFNFTVTE